MIKIKRYNFLILGPFLPAKPGVLSSVKTKLIDKYKILGKPLCFEVVQPEAQGWLCHIFTSNGTTQVSPRIGCIN
jgi:hypothetical protein